MPQSPAPVVGPSGPCLCGTSKPVGVELCPQCWTLRQVLATQAVKLLSHARTAPWCRELLEQALATKVEEPTMAGPA